MTIVNAVQSHSFPFFYKAPWLDLGTAVNSSIPCCKDHGKDHIFRGHPHDYLSDADMLTPSHILQKVQLHHGGDWLLYGQWATSTTIWEETTPTIKVVGISDCIRVWLLMPQHHGSCKLRLYKLFAMYDQMYELVADCSNVQQKLSRSEFSFCRVMDDHWLLYDQPNYKGRVYYLKPGEYHR